MKTPTLEFVETVAREAGEILSAQAGRLESVEKKGARDLVTAADRAAEDHVVRRIREAFPEDGILAEEGHAETPDTRRTWIIDPLDGTTNFVYGLPHYAVSIGWYVEDRPELACVHNPALAECYLAARGAGATKNGRAIRVREEERLSEALLATGFAYRRDEKADSNLEHVRDFAFAARCLRRYGSAALDLCYVAEGRLDGYWELHLAPWDVAAGALVAREAGAEVSDFEAGDDWLHGGCLVAANAALAAEMRRVLEAADPARLPGPRHPDHRS